ncbi:MAG: ACT domain-containing protein [Deltaproteobacteria bacterium]|nr:ACT domain-containing protein [Deltaproteobacteria bacterium]MBN2687600.1 ACT domain-containing protein [Deltaproteobacteria bacterium]
MSREGHVLQQISIFLDNKPGSLAVLARRLADHGINLRALSLAETRDFGTARLIVADTEACSRALEDGGYHYIISDVIGVAVEDRPGGMAEVLEILAGEHINVEYVYATVISAEGNAIIIIRVDDVLRAATILASKGVRLMNVEEIKKM